MYVHPFAMASCGHRGHDGSHESEPLVRLNAQKELGNRRTVERSPVFCLCRSIAMPRTGWSPNTVPYGADQTAYLVVDRFSGGSVYRETEIERADLETIISDFITGQFNDPVRVVAFNFGALGKRRFRRYRSRSSDPVRHCGRARARASPRLRRELRPDDATVGAPTGLRFTTIAAAAACRAKRSMGASSANMSNGRFLADPAVVWTYSTVGLTFLFLMTHKPIAMPMTTDIERELALACFVTAMGRCAFTGLYGSSLRELLYKRGNELRIAHVHIEELAQVDELTGTLNRRYVMKALNEEMARTQRSREVISVAIINLDFFKRINDRFGHPVGDEVLRTFSSAITANLRNNNKFGRYGGEEFLLVLPGTGRDGALQLVDRLRAIIADINWTAISYGIELTMSAGVCQVRPNNSADSVLARADKALYRAKETGRYRVIGG